MNNNKAIALTGMLLMLALFSLKGQEYSQEDILAGQYTVENLESILQDPADWSYIPRPGEPWEHLPDNLEQGFLEAGTVALKYKFEPIPATLAMEFHRSGDRSMHSEVYFAKRRNLTSLVMAECLEGEGRFLDQIANGIWSIAEESWWAIPAHYYQYGMSALPDVSVQYVDLFAAETAILFAWTHYLLGEELDKVSPQITKRILQELDRRVLTPCLEMEDFHWMGYRDTSLNNWTPWICSNWIGTVLLCEKDPERKARAIRKNMIILDRFLEPYNADGGCDEGPGYWNRAGASLYDCLEWLEMASAGKIDVWDHPLVQNIGSYMYKVHIKDDYYVNFADASALAKPDAPVVYRYGKKIGDERMAAFGSWLLDRNGTEYLLRTSMGRMIQNLFALEDMAHTSPAISYTGSWFPDLEVMVARSKDREGNGFFLAAKGGFNKESHNHNDVGSCVVYFNGKPVLIDVGVETYTKKTFSAQRYEIWTMQSQYHNLPTVNGQMQAPGAQFKASDVKYNSTSRKDQMSMDIGGAYPESAGIDQWIRTLELDKGKNRVCITEDFQLTETTEPVILNLMTHTKPEIHPKESHISIPVADEEGSVIRLTYPAGFTAEVESCSTADPRLASVWGEQVHRIRLTAPQASPNGYIQVILQNEN